MEVGSGVGLESKSTSLFPKNLPAEGWTTNPFARIPPGVRPPRGAEEGAVPQGAAPFRLSGGKKGIEGGR